MTWSLSAQSEFDLHSYNTQTSPSGLLAKDMQIAPGTLFKADGTEITMQSTPGPHESGVVFVDAAQSQAFASEVQQSPCPWTKAPNPRYIMQSTQPSDMPPG